jgi:hypothetical protein
MGQQPSRDEVSQFLALMHPQLVEFAQENFTRQGAGVVKVESVVLPPVEVPAPFWTSMIYQTVEDLRSRAATGSVDERKQATLMLRLNEECAPERQVAVMFSFEGCEPVAGKVNLRS